MGDEHYGEYHRPMEYEMYGIGGMRPMYDYRDYAEEKEHKEYQEKLNIDCIAALHIHGQCTTEADFT